MKLTINEAAAVLGLTAHQVRYQLKTGRLEGVKKAGKWVLDSADLPLTENQRRALAERLDVAREAFEKGLGPIAKASVGPPRSPQGDASAPADDSRSSKGEGRGHYSVLNLHAFRVGVEIHRELVATLGDADPASRRLADALMLVAQGCHSFHPSDKSRHFTAARDTLASGVAEILLPAEESEQRRNLARRIEREWLPKVAGLVARQEKRGRRGRFDRLGRFSSQVRER